MVASSEAKTIVVKATDPITLCSRSITFTAIEPEYVEFAKIGHRHAAGQAGSGFCAAMRIHPVDVSFTGVEFIERVAPTVSSGSFQHLTDPHPEWVASAVCGENNVFPGVDIPYFPAEPIGDPPAYVPGTITWDIPWQYRVASTWHDCWILRQQGTVDAAGTVTTEKAGVTSQHGVNDTSEFCP